MLCDAVKTKDWVEYSKLHPQFVVLHEKWLCMRRHFLVLLLTINFQKRNR